MELSSTMSQCAYVVSAVLIVSAVAKLVTLKETSARSNTELAIKRPVFFYFSLAAAELLIGVFVISESISATSNRDYIFLGMAGVFLAFSLNCFYSLAKNKAMPCFCFGTLSKKPARLFSCTRNVFLVILSVVAYLADPAEINALGIAMAALVLGAILYEEIH